MKAKQTSLFDNVYIDHFAGGGGASTGIEMATGQPVDVAINHDEMAIALHRKNHPYTKHYREDIWKVDPAEAISGKHVRLIWFSPDCKHFSRAKGAALVNKKIRGLAWIVPKWLSKTKPDVFMLENVPEFKTWGPVRKGKPIKKKAGQTFRKWLDQVEALGYHIEMKELVAADYGAPTIRKRLHIIGRRDGLPIIWPERSHAPRDSEEVKSGKYKPWRAAAEIIDWNLPAYSIFESKEEIKEKYGVTVRRPLRPKTMRRIAMGTDKFVIKAQKPFIVPIGYGEREGQTPRIHDIDQPLSTVVSNTKQYVCNPVLSPFIAQQKYSNAPQNVHNPLSTVTAVGAHELIALSLSQYHSEKTIKETRGQDLKGPLLTVDGANRYGLSAVHLTQYFSGEYHYHSVEDPIHTVTTMEREGLVSAHLSEWYGNAREGLSLSDPLQTVTAKDREALTLVHLAHFKGKDKGQHPENPLMSITASDGQFAEIRTKVVKWDGQTDLKYWPKVREMLNEHCDYSLADDEILLLNICGLWYFISDIELRMLSPRELYDAMSFPHDYVIDRDIYGNEIKRADQVAKCGNAVCPAVAEALVRANLSECPQVTFVDMRALHQAMVS